MSKNEIKEKLQKIPALSKGFWLWQVLDNGDI
jgi:hypothetical protein